MAVSQETPASETIQVGPDRVTISDSQVIIEARHEMPEWQVREYCRIPIIFRDQKYYLSQKRPGTKPFAMVYVLLPWDAETGNTTRSEQVYDEEAVSLRDQGVRSGHFEDITRAVLIVFFPLLGLLWSETKEKLRRFCFVPRTITGVSIMLTFGVVMLDGIFAKMLMMRSMRTGEVSIGGLIRAFSSGDYLSLGVVQVPIVWLDCILFALLLLDCIIRYGQHLSDSESSWGFLEWMVHPFRKRLKAEV